jgi:hypothetical protein
VTFRSIPPVFTLFIATILSVSGAESDDIDFLEPKPYEFSGNIELWPTVLAYNRSVASYALKYPSSGARFSDAYNAKVELRGQYQFAALLANAEAMSQAGYDRHIDSIGFTVRFNKCFVKWTPSDLLSIIAGKRLYLWGKGSFYNPVSFAGRQKDINAALEGYWGLSIDAVRSFNGPLATLSLTAAALPVWADINGGYTRDSTLAAITRIYALLFNTDIDLCLYADSRSQRKIGVDFSRNIVSSWEVHGEWAWNREYAKKAISKSAVVDKIRRNSHEFVIGTRWLAPSNTTFILDYMHAGKGHSQDEMETFYGALQEAAPGNVPARKTMQEATAYFFGQFVMTDYLYCKVSHPEPFTVVYFTPSIYSLANIIDHSLLAGMELSYARFNHATFLARYIAFIGKNRSEYGEKAARHRLEARVNFAF